MVMVGDPKQLPPTVPGPEPGHFRGLDRSLFERLMLTIDRECYQMLRTQYRCHPHISAVANKLTYDGDLIDGVSAQDRAPVVPRLVPLCFFDCDNGAEERQGNGSFINIREAEFVVSMVEALLQAEVVHYKQIGVISTYKAQSHLIEQLLRDSSAPNSKLVTSSTVDAFQGGERDITFLSCVRTKGMGFIADPARTNVALTRAKRHLFVVGKYGNLLQHASCHGADGSQLWQGLLAHFSRLDHGRMKSVAGLVYLQELLEAAASSEDFSDDLTMLGHVVTDKVYDLAPAAGPKRVESTRVLVPRIVQPAVESASHEAMPTTVALWPRVDERVDVCSRPTAQTHTTLCMDNLLNDTDDSDDDSTDADAKSGFAHESMTADAGQEQLIALPRQSDDCTAADPCSSQESVGEHTRELADRRIRQERLGRPMTTIPNFDFSEDDVAANSSDDMLQTPPASVR
mmetsp:Transcript_25161/g.75766  ORF Transcript_25161/g.75766 Transcript_25161/m.75766 type:complete len:458 (+) Transcript_25161:1424-2797(+)